VAAQALWWSAATARTRVTDPSCLEELLDVAALVLDLREGTTAPAEARVLRRAPCPVLAIGAADAAEAWPVDLVLADGDPDALLLAESATAAAERLAAAAAARPAAATTLAQVLRATAALPVDQALAVESLAYSLLLGGDEFRDWLARRPDRGPRRTADTGDVVLVARHADVLSLTLNRPHVHNAFDAGIRDALVEALGVAGADPAVRHVVIDGAGPSFCSGGDLDEFGTADDLVRAHLIRTTRSVGALLHELGDRTEVRIHGAAIGAGVELPAFATRVVATPDATFRLPEVSMGLVPGAGGTVSLPRRIGAARTLLLALSGVPLAAGDALRWGLVDAVEAR
jgi:enoyl-CoA hydratase/carnithine racemase